MLSRTHRFHGLRALNFVYSNGRSARGQLFGVKAVINSQRNSYRAAIVISKKIHKSAVARNRMRRRIYGVFKIIGQQIDQPYDVVVTVFSDQVLNTKPAELKGQLEKQLREVGALAKKRSS